MTDGVEYVNKRHIDNRCRSAEHNIPSRDMFIAAPTSILRRVIAVPTSIPAYPQQTLPAPAYQHTPSRPSLHRDATS
jgi:hypothetical protein